MIGVSSIKSTFIQFVDWNGVAWWARMINACMFRRCGLVFKHKDVQERAAWGVSSFLYIVFCCSAATFHQPGGASLAMGFVLTVLTVRFPQKIIPYFYNLLYTFPIQTRISLVTLVKPLQHNQKRMDFLMTFWSFGSFPLRVRGQRWPLESHHLLRCHGRVPVGDWLGRWGGLHGPGKEGVLWMAPGPTMG